MQFASAVPESDDFGPLGEFSRGLFLTNRCGNARTPGCNRALTKLEILEAFGIHPKRKSVCPCGCNSWRASNFKWWEELLLWRSWVMWWKFKHGLVAPNPSKGIVEENAARVLKAMMDIASSEEDGVMVGEDE